MSVIQEEDRIQELLDIKLRLEYDIEALREEKDKLSNKLYQIKEKKEKLWKEKTREFQKLYNLKIDLVELDKQVQSRLSYVKDAEERIKLHDTNIANELGMVSFEEEMLKMGQVFKGAANFYSEDCLRMELMKRHKTVNDKRVELTNLDAQYNELAEKIKRQKEEKARAEEERRRAEEERKRLEEERVRAAEEEAARLEREKLRTVLQHSSRLEPRSTLGNSESFLGRDRTEDSFTFNTRIEKTPSKLNITTPCGGATSGSEATSPATITRSSSIPVFDFSQICKWY